MRAGPLSDNRIIKLLNSYYIPVYSSNEDSAPRGHGPAEEKAEHVRIYQEASKKPCGSGAVYVYILSPDGRVIDGLQVARATHGNALVEMLEKTVQKLHTVSGPPVVTPTPQSRPPRHDPDSLVLHLIARGSRQAFPWREFPAENWIVLSRADWMSLLPPGEMNAGLSWSFEKALADKLLTDFYPETEDVDTNVDRSRIERGSLRATVVSVSEGIARVRLDGTLRMKHSFYTRQDDGNFVNAVLLGWMEFDTGRHQITTFELVTQKATYGATDPEEFDAALSSLAPEELRVFEPEPQR